jgi:predicted permease
MFRLRPIVGRLFNADDFVGDPLIVMISESLWRARYGADSSVVGRAITLGSNNYRIVGVLPSAFRFPWQTEAIMPLRDSVVRALSTGNGDFDVIAKLRVGVSRASARNEMTRLASQLSATTGAPTGKGLRLIVRDEMLDRKAHQFLPAPSLFLGVGMFVLLIACANVANLSLARAAQRRGEMAIRASLGASARRLLQQMLTESLLLGGAAAAVGTFAALGAVRLSLRFIPQMGFASWFHVGFDIRVVGFAAGTVVFIAIVSGLPPAKEGLRFDLVRALKAGGDFGAAAPALRSGQRRVAAQLALAMALFIAAVLFAQSFRKLNSVNVGYAADQIVSVEPVYYPDQFQGNASRVQFASDIALRVAEIPGAKSVAIRGDFAGLRGETEAKGIRSATRLIPDRDDARAVRMKAGDRVYVVSESYFSLLGLRILTGRTFAMSDNAGSIPVVVVSATAARQLWGASDPIGHMVQYGKNGSQLRVVGVVDDVRDLVGEPSGYNANPRMTIYTSTRQALTGSPRILASSDKRDLASLRSAIVDLVRNADGRMVVLRPRTLASQFDEAYTVTSLFGVLVGTFAIAGFALSIIGIYGVISFGIVRRTREIGIRCALGATAPQVLQMITAEGLRFVGVGLVIGLAFAAVLARLARFVLFEVSAVEPGLYVAAATVFGLTALLACYIPARRAARIDPLTALRAD